MCQDANVILTQSEHGLYAYVCITTFFCAVLSVCEVIGNVVGTIGLSLFPFLWWAVGTMHFEAAPKMALQGYLTLRYQLKVHMCNFLLDLNLATLVLFCLSEIMQFFCHFCYLMAFQPQIRMLMLGSKV